MTKTELIALAERVESAMWADRKFDAEIAVLVGAVPNGYEPASVRGNWRGIYDNSYWSAPHYTASIDAALFLVPSGCAVASVGQLFATPDGGWSVHIWRHEVGTVATTEAQTPALALTAAALRARAAQEQ